MERDHPQSINILLNSIHKRVSGLEELRLKNGGSPRTWEEGLERDLDITQIEIVTRAVRSELFADKSDTDHLVAMAQRLRDWMLYERGGLSMGREIARMQGKESPSSKLVDNLYTNFDKSPTGMFRSVMASIEPTRLIFHYGHNTSTESFSVDIQKEEQFRMSVEFPRGDFEKLKYKAVGPLSEMTQEEFLLASHFIDGFMSDKQVHLAS